MFYRIPRKSTYSISPVNRLSYYIINSDYLILIPVSVEGATRRVCDPAYIVGRITLVRLGFSEIMLGCVSSHEVGLYF